jgi:hypothetical protein
LLQSKSARSQTHDLGHVGVYRASNGKGWEAYVMEKDLVLLGVYPTIRAAVAARAKYWKVKARRAA